MSARPRSPHDFDPALQLVVACCRFPIDSAVVSAAAHADIDWTRFEQLVKRHRVHPLVGGCLPLLAGRMPAELHRRIAAGSRRLIARDLHHAAESIRLQALFDAADLPVLFLKGGTLGMLAYGRLGLKQSWDIDLLTDRAAVMPAIGLMRRNGYRLAAPQRASDRELERLSRFHHETELHHESGTAAELHWRLFRKSNLGIDTFAHTQLVPVGGGRLRTLADPVLFTYLVAHGQLHGWSRLKWLADLHAFLRRKEAAERDLLCTAAQQMGEGRSARSALLLCNLLFDLPIPPASQLGIGDARAAARLVTTSLAAIAEARSGADLPPLSPTGMALLRSRLVRRPGLAHVAGELAGIWTQPFVRARFPARLDLAYHLLRIPFFAARLPLTLYRTARSRADAGSRR